MKTNEDITKLIPQDGFDNYHIEELSELTSQEIEPIVSELLVYLKDMKTIVVKELTPILINHETVIRKPLIEILDNESEDSIWKYNLIAYIIKEFTKEEQKNYEASLTRIATKPTFREAWHETNDIAAKVLNQ